MSTLALEQNRKPRKLERVDITTRAFKTDPYPFYAQLRATQPVAPARWGKVDAWLVTRYDDALAVLKDPRFVKNQHSVQNAAQQAKQPWIPPFIRPLQSNILDTDDPTHARLRNLVHKAFTPTRVEQLQTRIQTITEELLDTAQRKEQIDLVREFALPLPLTVICELLGVPFKERDRFVAVSKAFLRPPSTLNVLRLVPPMWTMMRYLRVLFRERRANPQDDLLTALVQAEEAGDRLNEDELLAMVFVLLIAGHETTVNLIGSGTLALLEHPDQMESLRAKPELMKTAVEELLRYASPVETATERYANQDIELHGELIHKGELTFAVIASANRDERQFPQGDELDITRANNKHLSFGHGIHYCIGAPLARLEGHIAFNTLLQRLPHLQLAVPREKLRWRATPLVRGLEALPLKF